MMGYGGGGGGPLKAARVYRTVNLVTVAATLTVIPWDAESFDTAGFHDNVTNNNRLTIPAGVSYAQATAAVQRDVNPTAQFSITIRHKNSAGVQQAQWGQNQDSSGYDGASVTTGPVAVAAGDFFEVDYYVDAIGDIVGGAGRSSFSIQALG